MGTNQQYVKAAYFVSLIVVIVRFKLTLIDISVNQVQPRGGFYRCTLAGAGLEPATSWL